RDFTPRPPRGSRPSVHEIVLFRLGARAVRALWEERLRPTEPCGYEENTAPLLRYTVVFGKQDASATFVAKPPERLEDFGHYGAIADSQNSGNVFHHDAFRLKTTNDSDVMSEKTGANIRERAEMIIVAERLARRSTYQT